MRTLGGGGSAWARPCLSGLLRALTGGIVLELAVAQVEERGEETKEGTDLVARAAEVAKCRAGSTEGGRVIEATCLRSDGAAVARVLAATVLA